MNKTTVRNPKATYKELDWLPTYVIGDDGSFISLPRDIPCFRKGESIPYAIRKRGEVRLTVHVTANNTGQLGYKITPTINGTQKYFSLAQLVLLAHKGQPPTDDKYYAWARNRDASDARLANLAWVKASDTYLEIQEDGRKVLSLKPDAVLN